MKSIKYKIILLITIGSTASFLQAQQKHEFSIYGGGGLSNLNYRLHNINNDKIKSKAGVLAGVGYTFFFQDQWGFTTGAEYTTYKSRSESYSIIDTRSTIDSDGDNFNYTILQRGRIESQEVSYINIPLMIQFQQMHPTGFYAALGGKIGFPIRGKYKYSYNQLIASGYYPSLNAQINDLEFRGFGTFEGRSGKNDLDAKVAFSLAAETGIKWHLGKQLFLYTGVYADYGLNDVIKGSKNKSILPYNNDNPLNFKSNSILNSEYSYNKITKSFSGKVKPLAIGIKVKVSFAIK